MASNQAVSKSLTRIPRAEIIGAQERYVLSPLDHHILLLGETWFPDESVDKYKAEQLELVRNPPPNVFKVPARKPVAQYAGIALLIPTAIFVITTLQTASIGAGILILLAAEFLLFFFGCFGGSKTMVMERLKNPDAEWRTCDWALYLHEFRPSIPQEIIELAEKYKVIPNSSIEVDYLYRDPWLVIKYHEQGKAPVRRYVGLWNEDGFVY